MKYDEHNIMPPGITKNLPHSAQELYKMAYNKVQEDALLDQQDINSVAHRKAWAAVKKKYFISHEGGWSKK